MGVWSYDINQAEKYGLYHGLLLAKEHQVDTLTIMADSLLILHHMVKSSLAKKKSMENIMKGIMEVAEDIPSKAYFHVLQDFNKKVNKYANEGCKLKIGKLKINGQIRPAIIP